MDIILDFDGTCVSHVFPGIGIDIGAVPVLNALTEKGHNLILFTLRDSGQAGGLKEAVDWFLDRHIPLYGVQKNPRQHTWTDSPKAHGELIIDDRALGIPLKSDPIVSPYPFVDWIAVEKLLKAKNIL